LGNIPERVFVKAFTTNYEPDLGQTALTGDRGVRSVLLTGEGEKHKRERINARQSWDKWILPVLTDAQID
jgi:hypothetical protein